MVKSSNNSVIKSFTYEIIERITRFIIHLEEIENQFYIDDPNAKDKLNFIDSYKESLFKILEVTIKGNKRFIKNPRSSDRIIKLQKKSLIAINELHTEYLPILPRPLEPVELARFKRVIYKQIVQLKEQKQDISISINENIGEEIIIDPLFEYKKDTINELISEFNQNKKVIKELSEDKNKDKLNLHITIPRIDAGNTYRWSSLIHEMSHTLMDNIVFQQKSIDKDFLLFVDNDKLITDFFINRKISITGFSPDNKTLHNWLTECWCDLFACILIGPSFYFSQYLAFINEPNHDYKKHPPAIFRLYLIESILQGRFPKDLYNFLSTKYIAQCEDLILNIHDSSKMNFDSSPDLARISNYFLKYFKNHFFATKDGVKIVGNEILNVNLEKLVKKYVNIYPEIIYQLVERLEQGLPIPSIRVKDINNNYDEIPTYIQEIFLASWISRMDVLQNEVLQSIESIKTIYNLKKFYQDNIEKPIKRHDQAVLKSIQVSEWFDFYNSEKSRPEIIKIYKPKKLKKNNYNGILVDYEIKEAILNDSLKIIPIMDIEKQIGTTSIDVRLGTSFQLFYPDQYGIIDFTVPHNDNSVNNFSKRVNLDFIEGITITPGQFLLGHSMEYIKLPDYLCANLEGRSSFARLGIEIHMTAGFIDPGFEGVLTFEIYNAGPTTVKLFPGMRIGQMRIEKTNIPENPYGKNHMVKYKGLLEHNVSRQSMDYEVSLLSKAFKKKKHFKN